MKINCLIVDDEPIAQKILENYINRIDALHLTAKCNNAFEAMNELHKGKTDVMFLDIKMPSLSGLDLLKTLQHPPKVILTTAFSEFAVESYEYGVTDYLLKPVSFPRFLQAVNKILLPANAEATKTASENTAPENTFIFFKADKKIHKFYFNNILFIEGSGNYVKIHTSVAKPLMILDKLGDLTKKLPASQFLRIHKSFIVNLSQIKQVEGNRVKIGDTHLPVSATYKQQFEAFLKNEKQ